MRRIICYGEVMLRLKPPERERFFQSSRFEASFGGGEANVAVSLALLGLRSSFVTALPANALGEGALRALRSYGVDVSSVRRTPGRMGIYFLETGADARPSEVVYDRAGSAASLMKPGDFDWPRIFPGADWFHLTGITPALSRSVAEACLEALHAAKSAGLTVSLDLNYRKKLWNYGVGAPEVMRALAAESDWVIANEEDIQLALGIGAGAAGPAGGGRNRPEAEDYRRLAEATRAEFPNLQGIAITLRESRSADRNGWSACLYGRTGFRVSRSYELEDIVDRVGGGDSFAAGLIFGLLEFGDEARALEFAAAASALKHTIPGDFNLVSRAEIERLVAGEGSGRVSR